jgi:hypothetical protein
MRAFDHFHYIDMFFCCAKRLVVTTHYSLLDYSYAMLLYIYMFFNTKQLVRQSNIYIYSI